MRLWLALPVLLILAIAALPQQPVGVAPKSPAKKSQAKDAPNGPPPTPGTIEGSVTNSISHAPVPDANVIISGGQGYSYMGVTDASGKFQIRNVDPGIYFAGQAQAQGYVYRPATAVAVSRITVGEAQTATGVKFELEPLGVISGKVVDDDGEPLPDAEVMALVPDYSRGSKMLTPRATTRADDHGQYRLYGLPAGRYLVRAWARPVNFEVQAGIQGQFSAANTHWRVAETGYQPTYYPTGMDSAQAVASQVTPGGEVSGVGIRLRDVPVFHLRGRVNRGDQEQALSLVASPCGGTPLSYAVEQMYGSTDKNGEFDIAGLSAGSWCVTAQRNRGNAREYARETVSITDRSVEGVVLTPVVLKPLQGTVVVDGPPGLQPNPNPTVSLQAVDVIQGASVRAKDGQFTLANIVPETYLAQVYAQSPGYYVKSLQYGTQDVSEGLITVRNDDAALTVTLRADGGQLNGLVQTDSGDAGVNIRVMVAPAERFIHRRDLFKLAGTDSSGHFTVADLPPGDYRVFATTDSDFSLWYVPEFQKELSSRAAAVTIQTGSASTVQVTVISSDDLAKAKAKFQ